MSAGAQTESLRHDCFDVTYNTVVTSSPTNYFVGGFCSAGATLRRRWATKVPTNAPTKPAI